MTADLLTWTHPLETRRAELAAAGITLETLEAPMTTLTLRMDPAGDGPRAIAWAVGAFLPTAMNTWTPLPGGRAYRLGPDEWLVTVPLDEASLIELLRPHGGTATDVTDQRTTLRLAEATARELVASGCALDLRRRSFPPGSCAQTLLGQTGVLLVAHDDGIDLLVRTSFAAYLADWLLDAASALDPAALDPALDPVPATRKDTP